MKKDKNPCRRDIQKHTGPIKLKQYVLISSHQPSGATLMIICTSATIAEAKKKK
jgi:hypothetical protein